MRFATLALVIGLGLPGATLAAEPDTYIFDLLALQPYKGNFARLVKAKDAPDWVKAISVQGAGTAGPMKTVDVGGTPYRLDRVCKVDACAGNTLDVLWAPRGSKVWAALVEDGKPPVMLGDPKAAQAKTLSEAVGAAVPASPPAMTPPPAGAVQAPAAGVATPPK
ncbi:MAG: Ivy family c-type lysozyme inhibitor [Janthinobacterium lividum]